MSSSNRSNAIDFITKNVHTHSLQECRCKDFFKREAPNNVRTFLDNFVVELFQNQKWPKDRPIQLIDTSAGELLQIASVVTSLAQAGYRVEVSIMDPAYIGQDTLKDDAQPKKAILNFKKLIAALNSAAGTERVKLNGVFSHIDSYLAAVAGKAPLQFERISLEERSKRIRAGEKARYLNLDLNTPIPAEIKFNSVLKKEFEESKACLGKPADLVLTVDDIRNFTPLWLMNDPRARETLSAKDREYAYENEVVQPLRQLNPDVILLGTKKTNSTLLQTNPTLQLIYRNTVIDTPVTEYSSTRVQEQLPKQAFTAPQRNTLNNTHPIEKAIMSYLNRKLQHSVSFAAVASAASQASASFSIDELLQCYLASLIQCQSEVGKNLIRHAFLTNARIKSHHILDNFCREEKISVEQLARDTREQIKRQPGFTALSIEALSDLLNTTLNDRDKELESKLMIVKTIINDVSEPLAPRSRPRPS